MTDYHYETVSQALDELRKRGYTEDFNLKKDNEAVRNPDDFEIVEVYRYEGDSDPGDEAVVYAIESHDGLKGVLVSGYGASVDTFTAALLKKLGRVDPKK